MWSWGGVIADLFNHLNGAELSGPATGKFGEAIAGERDTGDLHEIGQQRVGQLENVVVLNVEFVQIAAIFQGFRHRREPIISEDQRQNHQPHNQLNHKKRKKDLKPNSTKFTVKPNQI